jgi:hypothetical protein
MDDYAAVFRECGGYYRASQSAIFMIGTGSNVNSALVFPI